MARKLRRGDFAAARSLRYSDPELSSYKRQKAAQWVARFEAEAEELGVRWREKRYDRFSLWARTSQALGRWIFFRVDFSNLPWARQAALWAHELTHVRWQRERGGLRWIVRWLRNVRFRWVAEMNAKREEYRLRMLFGERAWLIENLDRSVARFVKINRLQRIENVHGHTRDLLLETLREVGNVR